MNEAIPDGEEPSTVDFSHEATNAGQRQVNLIWERTQSAIAFLIVSANIVVWLSAALRGHATPETPPGLTDALFVVVGFYYGRTNHQASGGVGPKQPWIAR